MKNKNYLVLLAGFLFVMIGLVLGIGKNYLSESGVASASLSGSDEPFYGSAGQIPDEIKYLVLFQQLYELKSLDEQNRSTGETTSFKDTLYTERLGVRSSDISTVDGIVADCFEQIRPLDQQAQDIINQYRSQFPGGKLRKPQSISESDRHGGKGIEPLPSPPPQLNQLQQQKNQIILNAKEQIRTSLGNTEFTKFNAAVQQNASRILAPINSRPVLPRMVPTPN